MAEPETLADSHSTITAEAEVEDQPMQDAEKSSGSSGSDSDSDSDDEAAEKAQIEALEAAFQTNPSDYSSHVQYITLLRKLGDLEKLRQARETMSAIFPLTSGMWQEWAKDETNSLGAEAFSAVEKLYERGVSDYLSVTLWCDYLNFVQEFDPLVRGCSDAGISKARNLFERALTAAGLHFTEGHKIWELYREFEEAILITMAEADSGSKEKQIQRIRNLFHRQLSVPLANLRSTLKTYKAWEASQGSSIDVDSSELDGLSSNVISAYQKALEMLNARTQLEESISKEEVDPEKLENFRAYLQFEHSFGDPARIQILYERAIADFPLSNDLWLDYTYYLDKTFKTARIVREAYGRATRNCPWVGELWTRYFLSLERCHASEEELATVFEKSLLCTFSSYDEYLNVFLTRVDGLRRRFSDTQSENGVKYASIRDTFQRGSDYLSPHLKDTDTDSLLRMYSYWARLEFKLGKDLIAARGVWESFLKTSGSMLEAWQNYIGMEVEMGHVKEARSLYKRCYSRRFPGTGSEDICHSWVRFEREHGSLEDLDLAVQKVTPRLQELQLFRLQQESKNIIAATGEKETSSKKNAREKRKATPTSADEQSPAKRQKDKDQNLKKTNKTDKHQAKHSAEASVAQSDLNKVETSESKEKNDMPSKKPKSFNDQCTAFLSNLSLEATEDDLRSFFADIEGVTDIRILKDRFTGKSRGLAYVDFCDDAHLASALKKNKQILIGKQVSVLKSNPGEGRKKRDQRGISSEHGIKDSRGGSRGRGNSRPQSSRGGAHVQLKGRNTFAVPRTVKALGWSSGSGTSSNSTPQTEGTNEQAGETVKSNDEFRKMFLKE